MSRWFRAVIVCKFERLQLLGGDCGARSLVRLVALQTSSICSQQQGLTLFIDTEIPLSIRQTQHFLLKVQSQLHFSADIKPSSGCISN